MQIPLRYCMRPKTQQMVHRRTPTETVPGSLTVYTLTRIYHMEYTKKVEPAFDIIGESPVDALEHCFDHMDQSKNNAKEDKEKTTRPKP